MEESFVAGDDPKGPGDRPPDDPGVADRRDFWAGPDLEPMPLLFFFWWIPADVEILFGDLS